jgi:hypothetical protein
MTKILELNVCCGFQFQFVAHAATTLIHHYSLSTPKKQNATDISTSGTHLMMKKRKTIFSSRRISGFHLTSILNNL